MVGRPAADLALGEAARRHAPGRGEVRIELDRPPEQAQRLDVRLALPFVNLGHSAEEVVVGVEARGRLAPGPLDLGPLELRGDGADHAGGQLVLELEDVLDPPLEAVRPEMRARGGVDQVRRYPHPVRRLAHAAFQDVAHAELAPDLLHVHGAALVGEARVAGDHEQPAHPRQRGDDLLDHPVGEVLVFRVAAEVLKRQRGDRGAIGKGRRRSIWRLGSGVETSAVSDPLCEPYGFPPRPHA